MILGNPGLKGIYAPQVYLAAGAGSEVLHSGNKGKIAVIGYDAEPEEVTLLKEGVIQALVAQRPALEGATALTYAVDTRARAPALGVGGQQELSGDGQ